MAKYKNATQGYLVVGHLRLPPGGEFDDTNFPVNADSVKFALDYGFLVPVKEKIKEVEEEVVVLQSEKSFIPKAEEEVEEMVVTNAKTSKKNGAKKQK